MSPRMVRVLCDHVRKLLLRFFGLLTIEIGGPQIHARSYVLRLQIQNSLQLTFSFGELPVSEVGVRKCVMSRRILRTLLHFLLELADHPIDILSRVHSRSSEVDPRTAPP